MNLLQPTGDVDDPDVVYLPKKDAFLFISNTDMSGGLNNRIVGSVVQTTAASDGKLQVSGPEQILAADTGSDQGHPAAIENPFNGEIITAYDFGNGTAQGNLSYYNIGSRPLPTRSPRLAPRFPTSMAPDGDPFKHQHPQLAADPDQGVLAVGYQAYESSVGYPNAYVFNLLDRNGADNLQPVRGGPVFPDRLAGSHQHERQLPQHQVRSRNGFVCRRVHSGWQGGNPQTFVSSFSVSTASQAPSPSLTVARDGSSVVISWPASAAGFTLQSTSSLGAPDWKAVSDTPVQDGQNLKVTVTPTGTSFYRLKQ